MTKKCRVCGRDDGPLCHAEETCEVCGRVDDPGYMCWRVGHLPIPSCPVCASKSVSVSKAMRSVTSRFGTTQSYSAVVNKCRDCGEEGDFAAANDPAIDNAFNEANRVGVQAKLADLVKQGFSLVSTERILQLPIGSLRALQDRTPTRQEAALVMLLTPERLLALDSPRDEP